MALLLAACGDAHDPPFPCADPGGPTVTLQDHELRIVLLYDQAWEVRHGDRSEQMALEVVDEAAAVLADLGITLTVAEVRTWRSPNLAQVHDLAHALGASMPLPPNVGLLVALTGRLTEGWEDGFHFHDGLAPSVVVRHHHGHEIRDSWVMVHEIGHHLALNHAEGTYMQALSFPSEPHWTDCQRDAVDALSPGGAR